MNEGGGVVEPDGGAGGGEGGRGNGLPAQAFTALTDLEPELATAMLEVFREEGVAARVSSGDAGAEGDRLWVDAAELDLARAVLRTRLPMLRARRRGRAAAPPPAGGGEPAPAAPITPAEQAAWEELVAAFDEPPAERPDPPRSGGVPLNTAPDLSDLRPEPRPRPKQPDAGQDRDAADGRGGGAAGDTTSGTGRGPRDWVAEDDDEHFVPPEPPPLPHGDTTARLAWVSVLGGPALLLALAFFQPSALGGWPSALGVLLFVGGFATLVVRMKGSEDDDDDDPDGGAVV